MKILFICGGLEPGKDGVGDYTRRLSAELLRKGLTIGILAFDDKYSESVDETEQQLGEISIPCLRLPYELNNKDRCKKAKKWIDSKNPEWLSLQFVPYSFNKRGVPLDLAWQLKKIGKGRKWHIMFHELWLGLRDSDSFKFKVVGAIQKNIVRTLIYLLKFDKIHTHTKFYLNELIKLNLTVHYLPIFSNIEFIKNEIFEKESPSKETKFVIFGTIHPKAPVAELADEMSQYFKNQVKSNFSLILIGNSGIEKNLWIQEFRSREIDVKVLGELDSKSISYELQEASFGITTNPIFVIEKSGTVAAMREHNLPILIVAENTHPKNNIKLEIDTDLMEYKFGNFPKFMSQKYRLAKSKGVKEVSDQFLIDLDIKK